MVEILRPNFRKQKKIRPSSQRVHADELARRGGPAWNFFTTFIADDHRPLRINQVWVENHTQEVWVIALLPCKSEDALLVEIREYREDEHAPLVRYYDEQSFRSNFRIWDDWLREYQEATAMVATVIPFAAALKEKHGKLS